MTENIGTFLNLLTVAGLTASGYFLKQIYERYLEMEKQLNEHDKQLALHEERIKVLQGQHRRKDDG